VGGLLGWASTGPIAAAAAFQLPAQDTARSTTLAFGPTGTIAASGGDDHLIRLWDLDSGAQLRVLRGHAGTISGLAYTPDGQYLLSASADGTLRLWEITTGKTFRVLRGHDGPVLSVALSRSARQAVSGGADGRVVIWDLSLGEASAHLTGHTGKVNSVAYSPDGWRFVSGSSDGTIRLWDGISGREVRTFQAAPTVEGITSVAFSPDGRLVIAGSDGAKPGLGIWIAENGQPARTPLLGHKGAIHSVAYDRQGKRVLSGGADHTVRLWGPPPSGFTTKSMSVD
jgi:WD40 repeat protein